MKHSFFLLANVRLTSKLRPCNTPCGPCQPCLEEISYLGGKEGFFCLVRMDFKSKLVSGLRLRPGMMNSKDALSHLWEYRVDNDSPPMRCRPVPFSQSPANIQVEDANLHPSVSALEILHNTGAMRKRLRRRRISRGSFQAVSLIKEGKRRLVAMLVLLASEAANYVLLLLLSAGHFTDPSCSKSSA